jgi:hypothetical protein
MPLANGCQINCEEEEQGNWGLGTGGVFTVRLKAGHYVRSWGLKAGRSQLEAGALELFQPQVPSLYTFV